MENKLSPMPICNVCGQRESWGIIGSTLGPLSLAYCSECLKRYAEPLKYLHGLLDVIGGLSHVNPIMAKRIMSWHDGRYISWDEIAAMYEPEAGR